MIKVIIPALLIPLFFMKLIGIEPVAGWSWWVVWSPLWLGLIIMAILIFILEVLQALSKK